MIVIMFPSACSSADHSDTLWLQRSRQFGITTIGLARPDADLALRHGAQEAGNLVVAKVGAIAGALYRRRTDNIVGPARSQPGPAATTGTP
jgi:hypothetical protein